MRTCILSVLLSSVALTACVGPGSARKELSDLESAERIEVSELVGELHLALDAIQRLVTEQPALAALGLGLHTAVVSIESTRDDSGAGNAILVVAAAGESQSSGARSTIRLTLKQAGTTSTDASRAAPAAIEPLLNQAHGIQACGFGTLRNSGEDAPEVEPLWKSLALSTVNALDAYLCATSRDGDGGLRLDAVGITLEIKLARSTTEGAVLSLGTVSIGDTLTRGESSDASLELDFRPIAR